MKVIATIRIGSEKHHKMAPKLLLFFIATVFASTSGEMALENITRQATGDLFSLAGTDCGPTRCMEVSHGTALAALGDGCVCRCRRDTPAFREDRRICVNHIDECLMASFGRGATKPQIPLVFLPLKGQIIYPSKEIIFTDVEDAICAVTSAQYLSPSGWVTLRDLIDNDVPFGLYRDEGSTFLQWRGSSALHARLEGRLVAAHVLCSASTTSHLTASCAAFRVNGASQNALLDVRSITYHDGIVATAEPSNQNQGLSVLESLAIGVCVLMLIFIYAAGIIFYVHYKQKQKRKQKDPEQNMSSNSSENGSTLESRIDMSNVMLKTNPLLKLGGMGTDFLHDNGFSDASERTNDTIDSSSTTNQSHNNHKFQKINSNVISAMVHSRKVKKPPRPSLRQTSSPERSNERFQRRSSSPDTFERAPQSDLSIVDCSVEDHIAANRHISSPEGDPVIRRKLYFNPVFFETEHLKNPPPAAVEFLEKIREVMSIAKDKMTSKRFIPMLSDIPEEDPYQGIDLGWDFPCARRGRRFSAISLKQENTRKAGVCSGCPGCDKVKPQKIALTRSNSCKSCVSDDYKQRIVRKWLDEVPTPSMASKPIKSSAKVHGTPRSIESRFREQVRPKSAEPISQKDDPKSLKTPDNSLKKKPKVTETSPNKPAKVTEISLKKPTILTEINPKKPPKVTESIPKKGSKLTELIPNIAAIVAESMPNKTTKIPENIPRKPIIDSVPRENPNLLVETDNNIDNKKVTSKENSKNEEDVSRPVFALSSQEKKSPSNHASRRIRKKLPPPPPPPKLPKTEELAKTEEPAEPIPPEVKIKMEAVIRELHDCRRVEPIEIEEMKLETIQPIPAPKIVIPVVAADSHYFSDDNMLFDPRRTDLRIHRDNTMEFDSLERNMVRRRRFSLACGPEIFHRGEFGMDNRSFLDRQRFASSWLDMNRIFDNEAELPPRSYSEMEDHSQPVSEIEIGSEPLYDTLSKPGPLTIQVRGSPVESRRKLFDDFDPDTLDRKPKRDVKKRVEKILLKSAGSFKYKSASSESESPKKSPEVVFKNRIGNLRQIYESKAKAQEEENHSQFYKRRGSLQYGGKDLADFMKVMKTPDLIRHLESQKDPKPPIPPKYRHGSASDLSPKFGGSTRESPPGDRRRAIEERDRFGAYTRIENLNARRSGRRTARTRSRRTDLRKIHRTEDSGYMSTDSNESKRRAKYLMQLRPKNIMPEISPMPVTRTVNKPPVVIESDTDELESLCDGRSESGGESVETDSVFFGNFDDSKELLAELGLHTFEPRNKMMHVHEQIDSGFMGETNIILSGDSDSEHRSVISIMTGREGRPPGASMKKIDASPYNKHTIEC